MPTKNNPDNVDGERRKYLEAVAAAGLMGTGAFAGCLGDGGSSGEENTGETGGGESTGTAEFNDQSLEVIHPWTGGGGQEAINAVIEGFESQYPDIDTDFRGVGATANVQLNQLINQRLANRNPPGSFNAWPGAHLRPFVESDQDVLGDITESVWQHENFEEAFIDEAKELSQFDGRYVTVPIGSHRLNNLFYNIEVVESAGVSPSDVETPEDLVPLLQTIEEETDAVGMAQSMVNANTQLQLWAAVHLGMHGYQAYMDMTSGDGDIGRVRESLDVTKQYAEFFNQDASSLSPPEANELIMNGSAGVYHQGNWMAGSYQAADLTYEEDWGWIPFPGTENMYTLHMDAFVHPANNPAPAKAVRWHRYVGSKEAQINFNKNKGAIPVRTDVSKDEFGPFLTRTMEDFQSVEHRPPTLAHGLAVPPTTLSNLQEVFSNNFMGPYNVDDTAQAIIDTI